MKPRFNEKDRVMELKGSFIYIVDDIYWEGKEEEPPIYSVHSLDCPYVNHLFREEELELVGYSNYMNYV